MTSWAGDARSGRPGHWLMLPADFVAEWDIGKFVFGIWLCALGSICIVAISVWKGELGYCVICGLH